MQLEMFGGSPLTVRAAPGAEEPLLWVRRLVIWSEPGVILRDVPLRRGLNVVWSPDPADVAGAERVTEGGFGHGAGKSLFCRLIRYCLGETSFGTDTQREKIFRAYRDGRVGAEIVLRGTTWSIERALGIFAGDRVVRGVGLDGLDAVGVVVLGMDVFADALRDELLGAQASALVARPAGEAWLTALACLTRDQEARLAGATAWRVASAGSASPVADLPAREASRRFRVLVRASEEIERRLKAREQRLVSKRKIALQSRQQEAWAFRRRVILWAERLGLRAADVPDGKLAIEALRQAAAGARSLPPRPVPPAETASELELAYEVRLRAYHAVDTELAKCGFELTSTGAAIALRESELSPLFRAVQNAESPHCPLCEVPVDRVLLEGCPASRMAADLVELRQAHDTTERVLTNLRAHADDLQRRMQELGRQAAEAATALPIARSALAAAREREKAQARAEWLNSRVSADLDELAAEHERVEQAAREIESASIELESVRERAASARNESSRALGQLRDLFRAVVRRLVGENATADFRLDHNGIHLSIEQGGDQTSPGVESLKVIALDLAVLCQSIAGATQLPAFLVHDSPREADMGLSLYLPVFHLARELEEAGLRDGQAPSFQYIVTTTTKPPVFAQAPPVLCLELHGAPPEARLLKANL